MRFRKGKTATPPGDGAHRDEGRERSENLLTISATVFFVGNGNGNGKIGRENEIGITGYRKWNQSVGSMPITIGNR